MGRVFGKVPVGGKGYLIERTQITLRKPEVERTTTQGKKEPKPTLKKISPKFSDSLLSSKKPTRKFPPPPSSSFSSKNTRRKTNSHGRTMI
ncbi:MAG: hypothetical protein EZS28_022900 [Streblomastix strix]|uniref:Uncharacterized protein n=1 Tax=Streblomastix strix TaxID=222440 RepID=A0A5J4VGL9_9EUKA|nr:MAG: hypothetical protein EZS28_022900 [Streblomastix strix]